MDGLLAVGNGKTNAGVADNSVGREITSDGTSAETSSNTKSDNTVSSSAVTDAKQPATNAAQEAVDKHFPSPILEQGTYFDRIKKGDNNFSVFEPMNVYPYTEAFKNLAPAERFINRGWTADLADDLADLTAKNITETGGKGEFGTDSSHRQDVRSALEIAGQAGKLEDFVGMVNDRLDRNPATKILNLDRRDIEEKRQTWGLGRHEEGYQAVVLEGGRGGKYGNQFMGFDKEFLPHHSKEFVSKNLNLKYLAFGWTPKLSEEISKVVSDRLSATGEDNSFGSNSTAYSDSRSALGLAFDAGKLDELIRMVNQDQSKRSGHQAVLKKEVMGNSYRIDVMDGKKPYSQILLHKLDK